MEVKRETYTDRQAIQKYLNKCAVTGEKVKDIEKVKQNDEFVRLFTQNNQLVYFFIREIL